MTSAELQLVFVPESLVGCTFLELFSTLTRQESAIPLGLYRFAQTSYGAVFQYVYTNPEPDVVLRATDKVYVLVNFDATHLAN